MKKMLVLLLSSLLMITTLTACGSSNSEPSTDASTPSNEPVAQSITVAVGSQFTTLDPGLNTEVVNNYVLSHTVAAMFKKDDKGIYNPSLATDYELSEDGLSYTVHLKQDVVWSDGEPFNAHQIEFAFLRNLTYGADNAYALNSVTEFIVGSKEYASDTTQDISTLSIEGVQVLDDYTIQFNLTKPCSYFLSILAGNTLSPLREDFVGMHDSVWSMTPGYPTLGAYSVESVSANEKVVIKKNPSYFDADTITMDEITFMVMPDGDAQSLAFQTKEIDFATTITTEIAKSYTEYLFDGKDISSYFIAMNSGETGPEYMKDVNVRRALALAIDKATITEVLGSDFYKPLSGYVPYGLAGATGDFREEADAEKLYLQYNPEESKALLAAAGYDESNPLHITYKYSNNSIHGDVAQLVQQMWSAVGVKCDLEVVESNVFYSQLDEGNFEIARYGLNSSTDPISYLNIWKVNRQIVAAVNDPAMDAELESAAYIVDKAEYMAKIHELEEYFVEEMVYIIPMFSQASPKLCQNYVSGVYAVPGNTPFFGYATVSAH